MQIECSDEACVIKITFILSLASAPKILDAMPTTPTIPLPVMRSRVISSIEEIPFTLNASESSLSEIKVPSCSGLKVFLILILIFLFSAGFIVGG